MQGAQNISSLMDGELEPDEALREIARIKGDTTDSEENANRDVWDAYHLIGDVMRDGAAGAPVVSSGFSARFSARLAQEPTVLAPRAPSVSSAAPAKSRFQTYALSAAASVAAVAVVGWMALSNTKPAGTPGGELAKAPMVQPQVAAPTPQVAALAPQVAAAIVAAAKPAAAPEHMHEYLLAHQGISPSTAFQGVAPYVRTVSAAGN